MQCPAGSFFVRHSSTGPGAYSVTWVNLSQALQKFLIKSDGSGFFLQSQPNVRAASLRLLIDVRHFSSYCFARACDDVTDRLDVDITWILASSDACCCAASVAKPARASFASRTEPHARTVSALSVCSRACTASKGTAHTVRAENGITDGQEDFAFDNRPPTATSATSASIKLVN